jgi:hypothetical protein
MSWGSDTLGVTEDTFEMIKAATSGILVGTGIAGLTMEDLISWVPVDTPFFNSCPRKGAPQGALFAVWQALLNINNQQSDGGVQSEYAAPLAEVADQYIFSPYATVGMGGTVSWDAIAQGQNYADVLAVDTLQTINQLLIALDIHQLNAQSFALPTIGTVTLTNSTSGGNIASSATCYVLCAARSGINYYRNGTTKLSCGAVSAEASLGAGSGSTNSFTASVPAVKGAACYDWYVGSATTAEKYYTTTAQNTCTITSIPSANQTIPTNLAGLANAGGAGPSTQIVASAPDNGSFQTYWQNGLLASILGDFAASLDQIGSASFSAANLVTPGSQQTQGAYYSSLNGSQLTVKGAALLEIDNMNRSIYDTYQLTPTRMLMGSQVITDIANALLDNPQAVTWLVPTDASGRAHLVAGGAVGVYLNKTVNGKPITLELQPHLPPGKIISVVDSVPFPGANITTALEVETLYDFYRFEYGASRTSAANGGPRFDFEVRSRQAFKNKASALCGVLDNIGVGVND